MKKLNGGDFPEENRSKLRIDPKKTQKTAHELPRTALNCTAQTNCPLESVGSAVQCSLNCPLPRTAQWAVQLPTPAIGTWNEANAKLNKRCVAEGDILFVVRIVNRIRPNGNAFWINVIFIPGNEP